MRTVWRYLTRRFATSFLAALVVLVLAIVVVEMLRDIGEILARENGLGGALEYIFFRVPSYYLPYLVPVAAFVAALVTLGSAARSREFLAMKAGGISPTIAVLPVLAAGAGIALLAFVLNETVAVQTARAWNRHTRADDSEVVLRRGTFWYQTGRFIYNIRDADPDAKTVREVAVFELDDRDRLVRSIRAERARLLGPSHWQFEGASVRRFDPERPTAEPDFEETPVLEIVLPGEPTPADLDAEVGTLSLDRLARYVDEGARAGGDVTRARARLHGRLTGPLTALLFVFLAVPVALRVEETKSMARAALQGVVLLFVFYLAREYGATLASRGVTPAAATPWLVLASFGAFGAWRFARIAR